ncbi:MAG: aromatic alcohol reductase [Waterburya sp.]
MTNKTTVLVIGSTGMLGTKIVNTLLDKGETEVRVMVRPGSYEKKRQDLDAMKAKGAIIVEGDLMKPDTLLPVFEGVDVVVSAVGNDRVTVPGQKNAINTAKQQGIKRFIPSDYSIDYRKLDYGDNDNLDMRKEVFEYLLESGLEYTLVLNGSFMENIPTPYMPQFDLDNGIFKYWGDGETPVDMTTTDDTAKYTAEAVSDRDLANTALEVVGEVLTMKELLNSYQEATGKKLKVEHLGSVEELKSWIDNKKQTADSPLEYIPQQYEYAMVSGKGKLDNLQNSRYPHIKPLTVKQYIEQANL